MNLGDRLKEERERLGLSQTAFASVVDASKHSQISWEQGKATPNGKHLAAWSALGVDIMYVVTGVRSGPESPAVLSPRERSLIANYRDSDDSGRRAVEAAASAVAHKDSDASDQASDGAKQAG